MAIYLNNQRFALVLASALLLLLAGCGNGSSPETVEERAQARWNLLVEREFGQAWEYYTPGFRQTLPREEFAFDMRNRPIHWHAAEVFDSACEDDRCTVTTSVTYQAVGAPGQLSQMRMTRDIEEQWIRLEGQWWYVRN